MSLSFEPHIGEVWRWFNYTDHPTYEWDELWLMLGNDYPNQEMFLAVNLENGEVCSVWPACDPDSWEFVQ